MSPLRVLTDLGLAQWSTILFGFEKHWVGREEIFEYAMSQLLNGCESEHTAIIAGGGNLSDEELFDIISNELKRVIVQLTWTGGDWPSYFALKCRMVVKKIK